MKRIALFASGSGTNAENIIRYFFYHETITVSAVFTNRADAPVLEKVKKYGVPSVVFSRKELYDENRVLRLLSDVKADMVVLAGFLWLIPEEIIQRYPGAVVNIHPALLPEYGGKGMYGKKVHQAVIDNGDKESGITIHYVNEKYDEGDIIHQEKCTVEEHDTPESLAKKVHKLEYEAYPAIIESLIMGLSA